MSLRDRFEIMRADILELQAQCSIAQYPLVLHKTLSDLAYTTAQGGSSIRIHVPDVIKVRLIAELEQEGFHVTEDDGIEVSI